MLAIGPAAAPCAVAAGRRPPPISGGDAAIDISQAIGAGPVLTCAIFDDAGGKYMLSKCLVQHLAVPECGG